MSYKLMLDDERTLEQVSNLFHLSWIDKQLLKQPDWVVVRNYDDFCTMIDVMGIPLIVSFDHDLGNDVARKKVASGISKKQARKEKLGTKSGYDCAQYLLDKITIANIKETTSTHIIVHSMNPVGRYNILNLFK